MEEKIIEKIENARNLALEWLKREADKVLSAAGEDVVVKEYFYRKGFGFAEDKKGRRYFFHKTGDSEYRNSLMFDPKNLQPGDHLFASKKEKTDKGWKISSWTVSYAVHNILISLIQEASIQVVNSIDSSLTDEEIKFLGEGIINFSYRPFPGILDNTFMSGAVCIKLEEKLGRFYLEIGNRFILLPKADEIAHLRIPGRRLEFNLGADGLGAILKIRKCLEGRAGNAFKKGTLPNDCIYFYRDESWHVNVYDIELAALSLIASRTTVKIIGDYAVLEISDQRFAYLPKHGRSLEIERGIEGTGLSVKFVDPPFSSVIAEKDPRIKEIDNIVLPLFRQMLTEKFFVDFQRDSKGLEIFLGKKQREFSCLEDERDFFYVLSPDELLQSAKSVDCALNLEKVRNFLNDFFFANRQMLFEEIVSRNTAALIDNFFLPHKEGHKEVYHNGRFFCLPDGISGYHFRRDDGNGLFSFTLRLYKGALVLYSREERWASYKERVTTGYVTLGGDGWRRGRVQETTAVVNKSSGGCSGKSCDRIFDFDDFLENGKSLAIESLTQAVETQYQAEVKILGEYLQLHSFREKFEKRFFSEDNPLKEKIQSGIFLSESEIIIAKILGMKGG